jgi:hypothetical protein
LFGDVIIVCVAVIWGFCDVWEFFSEICKVEEF